MTFLQNELVQIITQNIKLLFSFCWFGVFRNIYVIMYCIYNNNIPLTCTCKPFRHTSNQTKQFKNWPVNMSELNMNFCCSLLTLSKFHWPYEFVFIWTHVQWSVKSNQAKEIQLLLLNSLYDLLNKSQLVYVYLVYVLFYC